MHIAPYVMQSTAGAIILLKNTGIKVFMITPKGHVQKDIPELSMIEINERQLIYLAY